LKEQKKYSELSEKEINDYVDQDYVGLKEVSIDAIPEGVLSNIVSPHSLAELIEARRNSSKTLDAEVFDCLTALEKEVVRLRFIENLTDRAIAERIEIVSYVDGEEVARKNPMHTTIFNMVSKIQGKLSCSELNNLPLVEGK
jgi:DNA-directed RNA polymerase specialized sigma subunit